VELIVPIILVKSLAQMQSEHKAGNKCYRKEFVKRCGPVLARISYDFPMVAPFDIQEIQSKIWLQLASSAHC
jgi:hypothetical protein